MEFTLTVYAAILALGLARVENQSDTWWVERFAVNAHTVEEATDTLVTALDWRVSFGVNDFTDLDFVDIYASGNEFEI